MFSLLFDLQVALGVNQPFPIAWKRVRHERYGHPFKHSTLIETHRFLNHPGNHGGYVYTVHLRRCDDCGMCFHDKGLEDTLPFEVRMARIRALDLTTLKERADG